MSIQYKDTREFCEEELRELFLSVGWSSGNYPDKLKLAMRNSNKVYSAWFEGKLVGLMNALSDGYMTAYFPYVLVKPEYHGKGIGKTLVELMLEEYKDCARKVLIAYDKKIGFYEKCGFERGEGTLPMSITYLTT